METPQSMEEVAMRMTVITMIGLILSINLNRTVFGMPRSVKRERSKRLSAVTIQMPPLA